MDRSANDTTMDGDTSKSNSSNCSQTSHSWGNATKHVHSLLFRSRDPRSYYAVRQCLAWVVEGASSSSWVASWQVAARSNHCQYYKSWRTNYFSGKIIIRDITGIAIEKIHQKQSRKIIHEITDVHKKLYKNLSENGWLKTHPNVGKVG